MKELQLQVDKRKFDIFNWNPEGEIQTVLDRQYFKGYFLDFSRMKDRNAQIQEPQ